MNVLLIILASNLLIFLYYIYDICRIMNTKESSIPKGMRDFNSTVVCRRNYILDIVKDSFERYAFAPIETPSMESIQTLTGKYGDEGDRLIFKVLNSGDYLSKVNVDNNIDYRSLTKKITEKALRYDLTVPFARFVAQNRNDITFPFKRYQMQNVWRADKPQKGRYREFLQCDADIIGVNSLFSEIELIQLYDEVFTKLNIPNINILLNNRKILLGMFELMGVSDLFDQFVIILDKLDKIGIDKVKSELEKKGLNKKSILILESFINAKSLNELSVLLEDSEIGLEGVKELDFVMNTLGQVGLKSSKLIFDITLARGLDYYTGAIIEVKVNNIDFGSIGGGGRYDDLTSIFGLKDISGVGISFGIDRIYLVMEELGLFPKKLDLSAQAMFVNFGKKEAIYSLSLLKLLRNNGIRAELYPKFVKLQKQMNYANKKNIDSVIMIGEDEIEKGIVKIKDMNSGEQREVDTDQLVNVLK